jgi:hypothetical protein
MGISNLLSDFRRWLDGEDAASVRAETPKARRAYEEFLVSVAREVEAVMQREMFTPPGGPTYIPREYLVFLSRMTIPIGREISGTGWSAGCFTFSRSVPRSSSVTRTYRREPLPWSCELTGLSKRESSGYSRSGTALHPGQKFGQERKAVQRLSLSGKKRPLQRLLQPTLKPR